MPDVSGLPQNAAWTDPTGQARDAQLQRLQQQSLNPAETDRKKLKKSAQEFEAIFLQQLLDAMDKTVQREGDVLGGGSAEETWRGMMNQEIARSMATRPGGSGFGLAEAIYRQMSARMPQADDGTSGSPAPQAGRF
jgi:flagellar protein FlgJ